MESLFSSFTAFSTVEQSHLTVEAAKTPEGKGKMDAGGLSTYHQKNQRIIRMPIAFSKPPFMRKHQFSISGTLLLSKEKT